MISCDDGGGGDDGITINGITFNVSTDKNEGGTSSISMSRDGNRLTVTGNLTRDAQGGSFGFVTLHIKPNGELLSHWQSSTGLFFDIIGDGNDYFLQMVTNNVHDYCYFRARFGTTRDTQTRIDIPYRDFRQPSWGVQVGDTPLNQLREAEIAINTESTNLGAFYFTLIVE